MDKEAKRYEVLRKRRILAVILLFLGLLVLIPLITTVGSVSIPLTTVWHVLISKISLAKEGGL